MNQTHPLVDAYLERLDGLLQGTDAATRAEVVLGVRDHLRDRLGDGDGGNASDDTRVRAALAELGTPEQVADEAYAGGTRTPPASDPLRTDRRWLPVTVMALGALALAMLVLFAATAPAAMPGVAELFIPLLYPPLWPVLVVLVVAARGWSVREKLALVGALPAACLVVALATRLAGSTSSSVGPAAALAAAAVGVVGSATVLVVLGRRGLARAR